MTIDKKFTEGEMLMHIKERMGKKDDDIKNYDGFYMDGFDDDHFKNLMFLSKFSNYMKPIDTEWKNPWLFVPIFFKGSGRILSLSYGWGTSTWENITGMGSENIILKIIKHQNPHILKK